MTSHFSATVNRAAISPNAAYRKGKSRMRAPVDSAWLIAKKEESKRDVSTTKAVAGSVTRINSMAPRSSQSLRLGRNVRLGSKAVLCCRSGKNKAGEPSHEVPGVPAPARDFGGIVMTPIRLLSPTPAPGG